MRPRPPFRRAGARRAALLAPLRALLLGGLALGGGCGGEDAPRDPAPAPVVPAPVDGPLATHRLATTPASLGDAAMIEALAPCRVTLEVVEGAVHDGARWRDLDPGDTVRIVWALVADEDPPSPASGASAPTKPGRRVRYRLRYGFDETDVRESLLRLDATTPSPWVRTASASLPVSAKPFPRDGLALATLALADVSPAAGLALVTAPVPAITGAPPGTPDATLRLVTLWLHISPR